MSKVEYIARVDKCVEENMQMLSSRNIEYLEKLIHIREKIDCVYGEKNDLVSTSSQEESLILIDDELMCMVEKLMKYKKCKSSSKADATKELKEFMGYLYTEFKNLAEVSDDFESERTAIKSQIKEIFALFN